MKQKETLSLHKDVFHKESKKALLSSKMTLPDGIPNYDKVMRLGVVRISDKLYAVSAPFENGIAKVTCPGGCKFHHEFGLIEAGYGIYGVRTPVYCHYGLEFIIYVDE